MAWSPSTTTLYVIDQLNEFVNFTQTISYEDLVEFPDETWEVEISASEVNETVSTVGDTIQGFYSNTFDGFSITYLEKTGSYSTVVNWDNISNAKEIVAYRPSTQQTKTYTYTATATSDLTETVVTQNYTIVVTNNWDIGKANLQSAVAETRIGR
jgi:hypothetical protein